MPFTSHKASQRTLTLYHSNNISSAVENFLSVDRSKLNILLGYQGSRRGNNILNNTLVSVFVFVYMLYFVRIFYELKSTIFNTIMLFRASIVEKFNTSDKS